MLLPRSLVHINARTSYRIVYQKIKDYGLCDPRDKLITIMIGLSRMWRRRTKIHEIIHAIDDEESIGLTEDQTEALELGIYKFLVANKYIKP